MTIERDQIALPTMILTDFALRQLNLMYLHDFTLKDKVLRIEVSGKDCDGFRFDIGFTTTRSDDFLLPIELEEMGRVHVALSPFASFYLQKFTLDYVQGHDEEGFVLQSDDFKNFGGKFWRAKPSLIPPQKTEQRKLKKDEN